jgi:preprotein translocase subunit SecG
MSTRTFIIIFVVVAALMAVLVAMHSPGGQGVLRSMRTVHGSRD